MNFMLRRSSTASNLRATVNENPTNGGGTPNHSTTENAAVFSSKNTRSKGSVRVEIPGPGPLGVDLKARVLSSPQRGAVVKTFRRMEDGKPGFIEQTGVVKLGDVLMEIHSHKTENMPFDKIIELVRHYQQIPEDWPLVMIFRRSSMEPESAKKRGSLFFGKTLINPAQDASFNDKIQYFRGFFGNRMPGQRNSAKQKPQMPSEDTVDLMYRDLLSKRNVPDDVKDELVRSETFENKWHVVWTVQQNENNNGEEASPAKDAARIVETLLELKYDNKGLKELESLLSKSIVADLDWALEFLDSFGLEHLCMKLPDPGPYAIEHHKYEKATRICEVILRILKSLTLFSQGVDALVGRPGVVKKIALCFHTENVDVKSLTLLLLGIVCYSSAQGHRAVLESFDHYKEVKAETIRYTCLRDALRSSRYSLSFKEDVLSFVNILVNKALDLEDRVAIRADFIALGMAEYFGQVRAKSLAFQQQQTRRQIELKSDKIPEGDSTIPPEASSTSRNSSRSSSSASANTETTAANLSSTNSEEASLIVPSTKLPDSPTHCVPDALPEPIELQSNRVSESSNNTRLSGTSQKSVIGNSYQDTPFSSKKNSIEAICSQLDSMEKQIEVFERFMEDDRKDTIYNETDLSDLNSVYNTLVSRTVSSDNNEDLKNVFLSIMQHLLFIPSDLVVGRRMWTLIERMIRRIVLTPTDEEEEIAHFDFSFEEQKSILDMRDTLTQLLQELAEKDATRIFQVGTVPLMANLKRRESSEEFSSEDDNSSEGDEQADGVDDNYTPNEQELIDKYSKYVRLRRMGMPDAHVELKMQSEGLTDIGVLDEVATLMEKGTRQKKTSEVHCKKVIPDKMIQAQAHPRYQRFFKLLKMGMPRAQVEMKMQREDETDFSILDTPEKLISENELEVDETKDSNEEKVMVQHHQKYSKFLKLLKMGMPLEQAQLKAENEGLKPELLKTPEALISSNDDGESGKSDDGPDTVKVKDHPSYEKYFKLLSMGMPEEHVKLKMQGQNLNVNYLSSPDALIPVHGEAQLELPQTKVSEVPEYAKFFKLLAMGMPSEHIKLKMTQQGLKPEYLDTPDAIFEQEKAVEVEKKRICEDENYAKYFKLLKMGMPRAQIKLKMTSEGLDADFLDTPNAYLPSISPVVTSLKDMISKPEGVTPPPIIEKPKAKYRSLYWELVSTEQLNGTIWNELHAIDNDGKNEDDSNVTLQTVTELKLQDENSLKELSSLFGVKAGKKSSGNLTEKTKIASKQKSTKTRVALIDVKRANNIGIMLARFRMPYHEICDAILRVNKEVLSIDRVQAFIQFAPTAEEMEVVSSYTGDRKLLGDTEQYFLEVRAIPRFKSRMQAILATWQFDSNLQEQNRLMAVLRLACNEINQSKRLLRILKHVLCLGNALNEHTARGKARGFKLDILLKLVQVKANDNGSFTLLNYLAKSIREKDEDCLYFNEDLISLDNVTKITSQVLKAGNTWLHKSSKLMENEIAAHKKAKTSEEDRFQEEVGLFTNHALKEKIKADKELQSVRLLFQQTAKRFGYITGGDEDTLDETLSPDSFFSIFHSFAKMLQAADRENERKRIAEEKRIRREEATNARNAELKERKKKEQFSMKSNAGTGNTTNSLSDLKTGGVEDIMKKIRHKRVLEKRQEREERSGNDSFCSSSSRRRTMSGNNDLITFSPRSRSKSPVKYINRRDSSQLAH